MGPRGYAVGCCIEGAKKEIIAHIASKYSERPGFARHRAADHERLGLGCRTDGKVCEDGDQEAVHQCEAQEATAVLPLQTDHEPKIVPIQFYRQTAS